MLNRLPRKDEDLNDAIEVLQEHFILAGGNLGEAWARLSSSEVSWIDAEIEKCMGNFDYYMQNYHFIKTEEGEASSLYPYWPHQEIVSEAIHEEWDLRGCCKIIILKPRQTGISTWIQAAMFHRTIFFDHTMTLLVAQNQETSTHVYNMSINAYEALPWWLRPEYIYKTKDGSIDFNRQKESERLMNPGLGSTIKVAHAQKTSGVAIGRTIRNAHLSEVSRWPDASVFEADIKPSMRAKDLFAIMESTAHGRRGLFYEHWKGSVSGDTGWRALFIPVYKVTKYFLPTPRNKKLILTDIEKKFTDKVKKEEKYDIPDGFWVFRRQGIKESSVLRDKSSFLECYPLTPNEAYQNSGFCAFDKQALEEQEQGNVVRPLWIGEILLSGEKPVLDIHMVGDEEDIPDRKSGKGGNRLHIWEQPESGQSYYVSGDAALGNHKDYSCAEVWRAGFGREPDVQVAEWLGWTTPTKFAYILAALGYYYNNSEIASEYQGPGITTGDVLVDLDYPNLYRPRAKDRINHSFMNYRHWLTNMKTRDQIIATMAEALLTDSVVIRSYDLIVEMNDFASDEDSDRYEGQDENDDAVMSAMIGLYCLRETLKNLKDAMPDSPQENHDQPQRNERGQLIWGIKKVEWSGPWVVRDHLMRAVTDRAFHNKGEADQFAAQHKGWTVSPHWGFAAADPWVSPIHQGGGPQSQIKKIYGVPDEEITPGLVAAYNKYKETSRILPRSPVAYDDDW